MLVVASKRDLSISQCVHSHCPIGKAVGLKNLSFFFFFKLRPCTIYAFTKRYIQNFHLLPRGYLRSQQLPKHPLFS